MEPVSAAASVVGLVAFAGQLIQALAKVNSFVQEMKDSDDRIKNLTRESKYLAQTLTELKSVLTKLEQSSIIKNHTDWNPGASSIQSILEACKSDLDQWEHSHMPKQEGSGAKRIFRLVWNGSLRKAQDLQSKFAVHRSQINTSIATINTNLSYVSLEKMESVHGDVRHLTESNLKYNMASTEASAANSAFMFEALREEFSSLSAAQSRHHRIQEETLSRFSSVSSSLESLASVASSLQRILTMQGSMQGSNSHWATHPGLGNPAAYLAIPSLSDDLPTNPLPEGSWSCRAIIGIDQALVELPDGQVHCLFCGQNLSMCAYRVKASHIIEQHKFADCNQNIQYSFTLDFENHLKRQHGFKSTPDDATMSRFAVDSSVHYDVRIASVFGMSPEAEQSAQQMLLACEMTSLLSKTPYLSLGSHAPATFGLLNRVMEVLASEVFSTFSATSSSGLPEILFEAANLEQEFIVHFNRAFPRRWAPVPECLLKASSQSERYAMAKAETQEALRPYLHEMLWPVKHLDENDSCHMCCDTFEGARSEYRSLSIMSNIPGLCKEHHDYILRKICPSSADSWCSLDPALKISAIFAELHDRASTKGRIDLWMLNILHKSDHLLAVLRCSLLLECGDFHSTPSIAGNAKEDDRITKAVNSFWGRRWTTDLLATFERDLGHSAKYDLCPVSDGAVDSRDESKSASSSSQEYGSIYPLPNRTG